MKKLLLTSTTACFIAAFGNVSFAQDGPAATNGYVRCGSMEYLEMQKKQDPGLQARMDKIEIDMQAWINSSNKNPKPKAIVKIPTVVHVVYANSTQNVTDQKVFDQIKVLTDDYRKLNTDWSLTPSAFTSLVADCEIEFCLATKDPSGNTTNGIVRKSTTVASFTTDDKIKYSAQGGSDAWTTSQYCNLWLGNLGGGLLGYAQFPGGSAATDGIVVLYSSVPGGSAAPYNLGRTATHEVGHWLNLRHINGDANCGNDQVSDTPTQDQLHGGCPTPHPYHANVCSGSTNGEMTMNYMDYTNDACMYMFSVGQKTRMQACLASSRSGLGPAAATKCTSTTGIFDVLSSDDVSIFPNPSTGEVFISIPKTEIASMDLKVFNAIGEAVISKKITVPSVGEAKVDLGNKPDGIYLFEVKTPAGTITKKIVISR